jgi:hypothetical protein
LYFVHTVTKVVSVAFSCAASTMVEIVKTAEKNS